jgi:hypothetical protein
MPGKSSVAKIKFLPAISKRPFRKYAAPYYPPMLTSR